MTKRQGQTSRTTEGDRTPLTVPAGKRVSKKQQLIKMLGGRTGVDVVTISRKLGWQAHTTRAAMTGLRKCGYQLTATKSETGKPARYKITATPADGTNSTAEVPANAG